MPTTCIVVKCGSRADRNLVKFYSVPTVLTHKFQIHKNELSKKLRTLWIAAIKTDDLTDTILRNQKVVDFADANYLGAEVMNIDPIEEETEIEETGIGIQTHLTMEELGVKFE
ncbi:hypothetical protein NQ315_013537 [Exocentrus adspersus]|uniref:Uncharacterized protein n=1 Tax=Exocentrus adspersus TaxID=1586481 RepID=A0AAV8VB54_9CUCU|nr:hypothetical protein NQ315_013537 [Exocentrus adspersus]